MRVTVAIQHGSGDEVTLHIDRGGGVDYLTRAKWCATRKLLVPWDRQVTDPDAQELADAVEHCDADCGPDEQLKKLQKYGELLFDAAFGQQHWQEILQTAVDAGTGYLEVAIRGGADGDDLTLQGLRWEALHDHRGFITAEGTILDSGGRGTHIEAGVVRLITSTGKAAEDAQYKEINRIPRVLFAVGSHLTDSNVRAGAEVMGIMRRLDRDGGSVQARVLDRATRAELQDELRKFQPDVLHLIGHGDWRRNRQGSGRQVMVQLRGEPTGEDWIPAEDLLGIFKQAAHWPTMVVLSACQTASAGDPVSALPFAARLVSGGASGAGVARGVPVVIAMAGDISDTTCRVFTQAMTSAIAERVPFWKAVIRGRRAAVYGGQALDSGHWVMPVLFLAEDVPPDAHLVDPAPAQTAWRRVNDLEMAVKHPVFCGRVPFLTKFDELLDGGHPLNVLVAYTPSPEAGFGGKRLLRELGARAVRSGVLPVLLGPYPNQGPQTLVDLASEFHQRLREMRDQALGLRGREWTSHALSAAREGAGRYEVVQAIRADLHALVVDLPEKDPVRQRAAGWPQAVLLCHRVDGWGVLDDLINMLGAPGLKGDEVPVPVVLTGASIRRFEDACKHAWQGPPWVKCLPLDRLSVPDDEDILAYLWWLLNPPEHEPVYALARKAGRGWPGILRRVLPAIPVYPADELFEWAKLLVDYFTAGNDDQLLDGFARYFQ